MQGKTIKIEIAAPQFTVYLKIYHFWPIKIVKSQISIIRISTNRQFGQFWKGKLHQIEISDPKIGSILKNHLFLKDCTNFILTENLKSRNFAAKHFEFSRHSLELCFVNKSHLTFFFSVQQQNKLFSRKKRIFEEKRSDI